MRWYYLSFVCGFAVSKMSPLPPFPLLRTWPRNKPTGQRVAWLLVPAMLWGQSWEIVGKVSQPSLWWCMSLSWHVDLSVYAPRSLGLLRLGLGLFMCIYFPLADKEGITSTFTTPLAPFWRAEFTDKDIRALHSSCLNGFRDHSPGRSLLFLAQPSHPEPAQPRTLAFNQPLGRACWGLVALGLDWLPGFEPLLCHF